MPALVPSPSHLFRSPIIHNLYPFHTLFLVLSMSFQNPSLFSPIPSLGPYQRILELTHQNSIIALCHTLFTRMATHSLFYFPPTLSLYITLARSLHNLLDSSSVHSSQTLPHLFSLHSIERIILPFPNTSI